MEALRLRVSVLSPEHAVGRRATDGLFERLPPQQRPCHLPRARWPLSAGSAFLCQRHSSPPDRGDADTLRVRLTLEALAPSRRPLPREDSDATGTAHDALLGTERSQGHRTSTLGCFDECQPGSGWHARCDCVAVAASHGCSADEATHHQKQVPRLPSKRARHFYPRR